MCFNPISLFFRVHIFTLKTVQTSPTFLYTILSRVSNVYRYIVQRDVLDFPARWSDRMQWTK